MVKKELTICDIEKTRREHSWTKESEKN